MKKPNKPIEYAGTMTIKYDIAQAKEYIRNNLETQIGDVPLWVLLSLGVEEVIKQKGGREE